MALLADYRTDFDVGSKSIVDSEPAAGLIQLLLLKYLRQSLRVKKDSPDTQLKRWHCVNEFHGDEGEMQLLAFRVLHKNSTVEVAEQIACGMKDYLMVRYARGEFDHVVPLPCEKAGPTPTLTNMIAIHLATLLGAPYRNCLRWSFTSFNVRGVDRGRALLVSDFVVNRKRLNFAIRALDEVGAKATAIFWAGP